MPVNTKKIENKLGKLEELDLIYVINSITSGILLTDAIDFMKKVGLLSEFMETLGVSEQMFIKGLLKCRPIELGENPFD